MDVIDRILSLFAEQGRAAYLGEAVTQTEHALQCAHLAQQAGADAALIAAALLHDVGHLLYDQEGRAEQGIDERHEDSGAGWLQRHFGDAVVGPVRLHVAAKRYLCAHDHDYYASLSAASQRSLHFQGGPFTPAEALRFEQEPCFRAALALRRWDDAAKVPGLAVPELEHYRTLLEALLQREEE